MWLVEFIKKIRKGFDFPDGAEVCQRLSFLYQYGFKVEDYYSGRMCKIKYLKAGLEIEYYEYYQFREFCVTVRHSPNKSNHFDSVREYDYGFFYKNVLPLMKTRFKKRKFSNLDMVEFYIRNQVEKGEDVFGINKDEFINSYRSSSK